MQRLGINRASKVGLLRNLARCFHCASDGPQAKRDSGGLQAAQCRRIEAVSGTD